MKKKYEIRLRVASGPDETTHFHLAHRGSRLERFLKRMPLVDWAKRGEEGTARILYDRDTAKYVMSKILGGHHRERAWWMTEWDILKMVACIRLSPKDVFETKCANPEHNQRYVQLIHTKFAYMSLHDVERDFTVFSQELDYFKPQSLTLQD